MSKFPTAVDGPWYFRIASFILYYCVAAPVLYIIGVPVFHLRVKGRRKMRGFKSGLLAANHCQYIEPGFMGTVLWPRKILFSAEENNVTRKDVGWLTRLLRAIGIPDENPLAIGSTIKKALTDGWFVSFYPEGTISWRSQEPGPFMEGVFFFAYLNDAPVFPIAEVLKERPIRKLFPWWPPRTTFVVCDPVLPKDYKTEDVPRRDRIHRMSNEVRRRIIATIEAEGGCKTLPERRGPDDPNKVPQRTA